MNTETLYNVYGPNGVRLLITAPMDVLTEVLRLRHEAIARIESETSPGGGCGTCTIHFNGRRTLAGFATVLIRQGW